MNVEELREYCLSLPQVKENMPWSEARYNMLMTFSLAEKWFCILDLEKKFINVKCDPEIVVEMQSRYQAAFPAWHMNKTHWLSIWLDSDMPDTQIRSLLNSAYQLILSKLPKKTRGELGL